MIKYNFLILFTITVAIQLSTALLASQYQKSLEKGLTNSDQGNVEDLEDGANKEDLKGSASHGYGYYGYPYGGYGSYGGYGGYGSYSGYGGFYSGYPYSYGLHGGYYGGFYPYYGGNGLHGHYF